MNLSRNDFICTSNMPWWISFVLSTGIFLTGFIFVGINHICERIKRKNPLIKKKTSLLISDYYMKKLFDESSDIGGRTWFPKSLSSLSIKYSYMNIFKILNLVLIIIHLISWFIYVVFTYNQINQNYLSGDCYSENLIIVKWIDFCLNVFCAFHFILRAVTTDNIKKFWLDRKTIIDILVIPNIIFTTFLNVRRQGLSMLRLLYLLEIYDTSILIFGFKLVQQKSEAVKITMYVICLWFVSSGVYHMAEGIGDFWTVPVNNQQLTFWHCCYFIMITIATAGYGESVPLTVFGRITIFFSIIFEINLFIYFLIEVSFILQNRKYAEKLTQMVNDKIVMVLGKFDTSTMIRFLETFGMQNQKTKFNLVVLNKESIDKKMYSYIKTFSTTLRYFVGSVRNFQDIKSKKLAKIDIAVILAKPIFCNTDDDNDLDNIMSALSLKAQSSEIRTIVQLHLYSNKILLKMLSKWNENRNDVILCINEMRLGLMAYNCLVPGISTLMTNLISSTKAQKSELLWQKNYENGLENRLYSVRFSIAFHGFQCLEVALILYQMWGVCLLAITDNNFVTINPMIENCLINSETMIAIIIARNETLAQRVHLYDPSCFYKSSLEKTKRFSTSSKDEVSGCINLGFQSDLKYRISNINAYDRSMNDSNCRGTKINNDFQYDETGSFYWDSEPKFENICLNVDEADLENISGHILVCICGSGKGSIDLCNFMMPLRFRTIPKAKLRKIVILGNKSYFEGTNWQNIKNFPDFLIINGCPNKPKDLRISGLFQCHSCVIINGNDGSTSISDKSSLICSILVKSLLKAQKSKLIMITEIRKDEISCFFSSKTSQLYDTDVSVEHNESYARGLIFTNSIMYRSIYAISDNPDTQLFIQTLLTGPFTNKVEKMLGYGFGLLPQTEKTFKTNEQEFKIFQLISLSEPPLNEILSLYDGNITYEILFKWALMENRILCLGLYRLYFALFRYVFTNPPKTTQLYITDKVYCCLSNKYNFLDFE